ncbi:hypothetical protein ACFP51_28465 [Streptomyces pratens]|uniref:Uncharacterized protein n=1 Tax=Streptomyces pratens TaxID=887456 RepID=A0ABW1LX18_9ACTN
MLDRVQGGDGTAPPQPPARPTALVVPDYGRTGLDVAHEFFTLIDEGVRPAIVTKERADDDAYLKRRGVTELREVATCPVRRLR